MNLKNKMEETVKTSTYAFVIVVVVWCKLYRMTNADGDIKTEHYTKCPRGLASQLSGYLTSARSPLDCLQICSQSQGCSGVNICPGNLSTKTTCWMADGVGSAQCHNLTVSTSSSCYYAYKRRKNLPEVTTPAEATTRTTPEATTTELVCENGGTVNGDRCDCPIQYSGKTCHRLIRDCTEPYERGHRSHSENVYRIHPITSQSPFPVLCDFQWGGITYPFWRTSTSAFNQDWDTCKAGFGDDIASNPSSKNFFIGLENLHRLLQQAKFELHIYMHYYENGQYKTGGAFYMNFTIGPESTSYAISYDTFNASRSRADDGFSTSFPVKFSANGNDVNGCFQSNNMAGWYGTDCSGHSMFSTGDFYWPFDGQSHSVDQMEFNLVRLYPYDD